MSNKETGGPAFPVTRDAEAQNDAWGGMTLRDYFAAKAMQGLLSADVEFTMSGAVVAKLAMQQADAMLEARK